MKKLLLICLLGTYSFLVTEAQLAPKFALFEHFTQASCGPCADQNPAFQELYDQNLSKAHHIAYHTSWPGFDPMHNLNPDPVNNRVAYYGVDGVPTMEVSGTLETNPASVTEGMIDGATVGGSPVRVLVDQEMNNDGEMEVTINVNTLAEVPEGDWILRIAVLEKFIEYASPPGSNGEREFPNVVRDMIPTAEGITFEAAEIGDKFTYEFSYAIQPEWNTDEMYVVAFIQRDDTKEVLNSGSSNDWKMYYTTESATSRYLFSEGEALFDGTLTSIFDQSKVVDVSIATNAPDDWNFAMVFPLFELSVPETSFEFEANSDNPIGLKITPGETKALGKYILRMSDPDNPLLFVEQVYYVNNGETDLVINSNIEWAPLYEEGLSLAGNPSKSALSPGEYLALEGQGILLGLKNIYLNIGWTFPSLYDDLTNSLSPFLETGGSLLIAGQDIGWDTWADTGNGTTTTRAFYSTYMGAEYLADGTTSNNSLYSVESDAFYGVELNSTVIDAYAGNMYPDEIQADGSNSTAILSYDSSNSKIAGVRNDNGNYKVVYLGIGIEMIQDEAVRNQIMDITYWYFKDQISGLEFDERINAIFSSAAYPNPANEIAFISLNAQDSDVQFELFNLEGKLISSQTIAAGSTQYSLNTGDLAQGQYFYQITGSNGQKSKSEKLTIVH